MATFDQLRRLFPDLRSDGTAVSLPLWPPDDPASVDTPRPPDLGAVFDACFPAPPGSTATPHARLPLGDGDVELVAFDFEPAYEDDTMEFGARLRAELAWRDVSPWHPIPSEPTVAFELDTALLEWDDGDAICTITGTVELPGNLVVDASVTLPHLVIDCVLHPRDVVDDGSPPDPADREFLVHHGLSFGDGVHPTLRSLHCRITEDSASFTISVDQLLSLDWIDVVNVQAHAEFARGLGAGGAAWAMSAMLAVPIGGDHEPLAVHVAGSHSASGWSFAGELAPPADLTLRTIVEELLGPQLGPQVPALVADLALVELAVTHTGGTRPTTTLSCRVQAPDPHDPDGPSLLRIVEANLDVVHDGSTSVEGQVVFEFAQADDGQLVAHFVHDADHALHLSAHLELHRQLGPLAAAVLEAQHVPELFADLQVTSLDLDLDPTTGEFALACAVDWDDPQHAHTTNTDHAVFSLVHVPGHGDQAAVTRVDGELHLHGTVFRCAFAPGGGPALFELVTDGSTGTVALGDLLESIGITAAGDLVFDVALRDAAFVLAGSSSADRRRLFLADLDLALDLSALGDLPIVGPGLSGANRLELTFHAVAATEGWTDVELADIGQALHVDGTSRVLVVPSTIPEALEHIDVSLKVGDADAIPLTSGGKRPSDTSTGSAGTPATPDTSKQDQVGVATGAGPPVTWHQLGRSFGPVHVEAIGVGVAASDQSITVLLAGSVSVGGLTVSLLGFGGKYTMRRETFSPVLRGLGLDVKRDPLEIAGEFLVVGDEFRGGLLIRTDEFTIHAFGAFKMIDGKPSMFAYGILDKPLGGPGFFFVEQLAAGFGYNRTIILPGIDGVRAFPLIAAAIGTGESAPDPENIIPNGLEAFPSEIGSYFFAVGVKANTYQLLDTVLVLALMVGPRTRIALLGNSTFQTPPSPGRALPMARVELDLLGEVDIAAGTVLLRGALNPASYVLHPHCQLSGEFAFATWFQGTGPPGSYPHAGDFVLTVGGYHPRFKAPSHYPTARRIALHYPVTRELTVSGSGYFALTPSAFMAGAAISARYDDGSVRASFSASLDFLLQWKPFHYDISVAVTVSASWWIFHADVHADVNIWGPDFAGTAHVRWSAISFTIEFGASGRPSSAPIDWSEFRRSFLPAADVVGIRVVDGTVAQYKDDVLGEVVWIVDRTRLAIETDSHIPGHVDGTPIRPMQRAAAGSTIPRYTFGPLVTQTDASGVVTIVPPTTVFTGAPADTVGPFTNIEDVDKAFPTALWGAPIAHPEHALQGDATVTARAGSRFRLKPHVRANDHDLTRSAVPLPPTTAPSVAPPAAAATFRPPATEPPVGVASPDDRDWTPESIATHVSIGVS